MRVLLVDDERDLVSALAERLGFRKIEAHYATSGEEALKLAAESTYDVAVLDVKMPRLGGIELCRKLREIQPGLKVVFLTGHGSEDDFRAGRDHGESYLIKPVRIEDLIAALERAVGCQGGAS